MVRELPMGRAGVLLICGSADAVGGRSSSIVQLGVQARIARRRWE
jgi:hypothetical protein